MTDFLELYTQLTEEHKAEVDRLMLDLRAASSQETPSSP